MRDLLYVAIGGALGAMSRYTLCAVLMGSWTSHLFPIPTLVVNLLGCFAAGAMLGVNERFEFFTEEMRLLLLVGILGGFTTFSAFGIETLALIRRNDLIGASFYVSLSVIGGVAAVWLGAALCRDV